MMPSNLIPEDPQLFASWLESHLMSFSLEQIIDDLSQLEPPISSISSDASLEVVLEESSEIIATEGFAALADEQLGRIRQHILEHPIALINLQELVFIDGGAYWDRRLNLVEETVPPSLEKVVVASQDQIRKQLTQSEMPRGVVGSGSTGPNRNPTGILIGLFVFTIGCMSAFGVMFAIMWNSLETTRQLVLEKDSMIKNLNSQVAQSALTNEKRRRQLLDTIQSFEKKVEGSQSEIEYFSTQLHQFAFQLDVMNKEFWQYVQNNDYYPNIPLSKIVKEYHGHLLGRLDTMTHKIILTSKNTYHIDLQSTDFSACLEIRDLKGKLLVREDNVTGVSRSKTVFSPETTGEYSLIVSSNNREGGYNLIVSKK